MLQLQQEAPHKTASHLRGDWLLLIIPGLIWGASFLFMAEGLRSVGPLGISFIRILIGFATLALFPSARKPVARSDFSKVVWLAILWFAFPLSLFPYAEQRVSSALTGMLNGANPLFATMVACWIARRPPSRGVAAGLAVGLTGSVLMAIPAMNVGESSTIGIVMIVAALISYGFALSIARDLQMRYGAVPVIWRAQGVAMILTAPLGLRDLVNAHWSIWPLLSLLALGAFGTAIANVLMAAAAGRFGAARASGTTFLIPGVALALGIFILNEKVALLSIMGGIICTLGAWLMKRAHSH
jgi:drug/metabolite transporter (DMT)-like permease